MTCECRLYVVYCTAYFGYMSSLSPYVKVRVQTFFFFTTLHDAKHCVPCVSALLDSDRCERLAHIENISTNRPTDWRNCKDVSCRGADTSETAKPTQALPRFTACRATILARDNDTSAWNASQHWAGLDE